LKRERKKGKKNIEQGISNDEVKVENKRKTDQKVEKGMEAAID